MASRRLHEVLVYFGVRTDPDVSAKFDGDPTGWRLAAVLAFFLVLVGLLVFLLRTPGLFLPALVALLVFGGVPYALSRRRRF